MRCTTTVDANKAERRCCQALQLYGHSERSFCKRLPYNISDRPLVAAGQLLWFFAMLTCTECKNTIFPGDLRYTGAEGRGEFWHAACYAGDSRLFDAAVRRSQSGASAEPYLARARGGFLIHLVKNGRSLCGHEPKARTEMGRAGWERLAATPQSKVTCKKCEKANQK
ncbi:hypothetical protein F6X40_27935 [Paraburkholderia sp. UCT31]|uniref:hypothetical protein n=1 Tax=Paraburkholderia sp. UCT31 TaxID=2615209 RepID=UPI001655E1DC|nr:hypothetical protein [Paraburkholderia sp. UCT31]MBC8740471.1 hypothetical protein [Paraburkholderia sp. UCT31]